LGASCVLVQSFARIHATNLKKQGVLALTFAHSEDYQKVQEDDRISIVGLADFAPKQPLTVILHHSNGKEESIQAKHSYNLEQIKWFQAGSALNALMQNMG